ncbi:MAG: hypothetical protein HQL50_11160 [Magnetococcales bacterium]|nr:hypothetical protein [Magnetococcales bacterium]
MDVEPADGSEVDVAKLSSILIHPDEHIPDRMVEALYCVNEMSTPDGMDMLLAACKREGVCLDIQEHASPTEVALQVWMERPGLLEESHAAILVTKTRSFDIFRSVQRSEQGFQIPGQDELVEFESELCCWFEQNRRGRGCKVFIFDHGAKMSFLIRHGKPVHRQGIQEEGESSSICFRPETHDVVVYDRSRDELAIRSSGSTGEQVLYRYMIGKHFFGSSTHFIGKRLFTLKPLERDRRASLVCSDIEGLEWIRLTQYEWKQGGKNKAAEIRKAEDLFAMFEESPDMPFPPSSELMKVVFSVKLREAKKPRNVTIRRPNKISYQRDEDSHLIEQWLQKRGFMRKSAF